MTTYVINDTFTDADTTEIDAHTGETGATWTKSAGSESPGQSNFRIVGNALRRTTNAEDPAYAFSEAQCYASGTLLGGWTNAVIEFGMYLQGATTENLSGVAIYEAGGSDGGFGEQLLELTKNTGNTLGGSGGYADLGTLTWTTAQVYDIKLDITDDLLTVYRDGALLDSVTRAGGIPVEPFGLALYDGNGEGACHITYFRVYSGDPPPPFWTTYVETTETDS